MSPDWAAWLDRHGARLMLYARQQTRSEADAEDVLQEALVQLVRAVERRTFEGGEPQLLAYALTAIRHRATDVARRSMVRRRYERANGEIQAAEQENPWMSSALDDDVYRAHVEGILKRIPEDFAEVLILKIWEGLTFVQIAAVTGEHVSTVNTRYRRALARFRAELVETPLPE